MISDWFILSYNIIEKYKIQLKDFYNFNKIDFIINIITAFFIIIYSEKHKKAKVIQSDNQEWFIIIKYINISDWYILFFMIIKDIYHLINWNIESDFLDNWIIKLTNNRWTNNKIGLN